jgi:N utilization substance protein A
VIAGLLVTEGFAKVEDLAAVPLDELSSIEGFDEGVAQELKARAEAWVERRDEELTKKFQSLGVTDEVAAIAGMTPTWLVKLGEKGVKSLDDLGDLAGDELREIVGNDELDEEAANAMIMAARAHWFADEEQEQK